MWRLALLLLFICLAVAHANEVGWEFMHGPYGGAVKVLTAMNDGEVWAVTPSNGLMHFDPSDSSWTPVNPSTTDSPIPSIVASDHASRIGMCAQSGVCYLSNDGGHSWQRNQHVFDGAANCMLYAKSGDIYVAEPYIWGSRLFRSKDNGATWVQMSLDTFNDTLPSIRRLIEDPSGHLWVTTVIGLYEKSDQDTSWYHPTNGDVGAFCVTRRGSIFMWAQDSMYSYWNFLRSTDGGVHWDHIPLFLYDNVGEVTAITEDSVRGLIVGMAVGQLLSSVDEGRGWWGLRFTPSVPATQLDLVQRKLTICTAGSGVYQLDIDAGSWSQIGMWLSPFSIAYSNRTGLVAGTNDGIYRFDSVEKAWTRISTCTGYTPAPRAGYYEFETNNVSMEEAPAWITCVHRVDSTNIIATSTCIRVPDDGYWTKNGAPVALSRIAADMNGHVYGAGCAYSISGDKRSQHTDPYGIVVGSENYGVTWTTVDRGLYLWSEDYNYVACGAEGEVFDGDGKKLGRSSDFGKTWTTIYSGGGNITRLIEDGREAIYAAFDSRLVVRSTDHGAHWDTLIVGRGQYVVRSLCFKGDSLFAGQDTTGVWLSTDRGTTWTSANRGMKDLILQDMAQDSAHRLYVTSMRGIYRSTYLPPTTVQAQATHPFESITMDIFPNPASTSVTCTLNGLSTPGRLDVMDALGRRVWSADCHASSVQQIPVASFASGLYACVWVSSKGRTMQYIRIAK